MTDQQQIACSLSASDLEQRLEQIGALGGTSLIARKDEAGTHTLRFRNDEETRMSLEAIVAAERRCCAFLELSLSERGGELVLTIAAPAEGQTVADELAAAFG